MDRLRTVSDILKIAKELMADYKYIYDPEHKKHPGGGYVKTQKGWQKGKQDKEQNNGGNKKVTRKDIENKVSKLPKEKIKNIAKNEKTPQMVLDVLSNFEECKLAVAINKNTHPKTLDRLADNKDWNVRNAVALNPNTSAKTLDKLSNDEDEWLRRNIADNPNTSSKTLDKLSNDKSDVVYHAIPHNQNANGQQIEHIYDRIMEDYEEDKKNAESGKLLQQSKYASDNWALEEIAKHKNTKLDTLNQMVQKFPEGSKIGDIVRNRLKMIMLYKKLL